MTEPFIIYIILQKFWEVKEPVINNALFSSDQKCENNFCKPTNRNSVGRFTVSLLFNLYPSLFGNSCDIALSRFKNLERKLQKDVYRISILYAGI